MDIYTQEATTKYAEEYAAVQDMVDNIVLTDAVASVKPASASIGVGFGVSPVAAISFEPAAAGNAQAAQKHAQKFAETINKYFFVKSADGKQVPLVDKDLVKVDGNTVNVDLGAVHALFTKQPILPVDLNMPMLSEAAKQYSLQTVGQQAAQNAQAQVLQAIQARKMQRQQKAAAEKIYPECAKVIEDPQYLKEMAKTDPQAAAMVQAVLREVATAADEVTRNPDVLEQIRQENPDFAGLVEKSAEKAKEKTAQEKPAREDAEPKSFVTRVSGGGDLAPGKSAGASRG
jgi:hypothetical protein